MSKGWGAAAHQRKQRSFPDPGQQNDVDSRFIFGGVCVLIGAITLTVMFPLPMMGVIAGMTLVGGIIHYYDKFKEKHRSHEARKPSSARDDGDTPELANKKNTTYRMLTKLENNSDMNADATESTTVNSMKKPTSGNCGYSPDRVSVRLAGWIAICSLFSKCFRRRTPSKPTASNYINSSKKSN